ncbi:hypothetical protein M0805_009367 [Coniferiporia weirii]|nr:hypothetical protein M0805_009367 [Coniferiporia weirii]
MSPTPSPPGMPLPPYAQMVPVPTQQLPPTNSHWGPNGRHWSVYIDDNHQPMWQPRPTTATICLRTDFGGPAFVQEVKEMDEDENDPEAQDHSN